MNCDDITARQSRIVGDVLIVKGTTCALPAGRLPGKRQRAARQSSASADSSRWVLQKRIQRLDPALFKVCGVSRDDGERVAAGGGGDLAV